MENEIVYEMPEGPEGAGSVQDGDRALIIGISTKRDIIARIGYVAVPPDDAELKTFADAVCKAAKGKPVMTALTLSRDDVIAAAGKDAADEKTRRRAAMALAALRQAVNDYAARRTGVTM